MAQSSTKTIFQFVLHLIILFILALLVFYMANNPPESVLGWIFYGLGILIVVVGLISSTLGAAKMIL